ncbi:hypothetical protein B9Z55_027578 [Caenorhabditis nigoni]|uniref:Uncharacterized protein n=1 Tax=Caenorhabditis nigoni TaxID=1611254 RepID=A0A2G5SFR8_9PELO|nr:hypothetical protein B9Z55_027578 [Caenorhabditis nigoni]
MVKFQTKEGKRELQNSQGRASFKNSLQKKKNKKTSLEEHSKDLDVELRDVQESLKQLEDAYREKYPDLIARKNDVAQLIEKENQDCRKKLEEEVRNFEEQLKTIARQKNRPGIVKTSNASAKSRTKQKLEIALLELKVHQQQTEIEQMDMIVEYLKRLLS